MAVLAAADGAGPARACWPRPGRRWPRRPPCSGADVGDGDVLGALARVLAVVALRRPDARHRATCSSGWSGGIGREACGGAPRTGPVRRGAGRAASPRRWWLGLGWAWWPNGDRYRPVRAYEGGTVLDVVAGRRSGRRLRGRRAGLGADDLARGRRRRCPPPTARRWRWSSCRRRRGRRSRRRRRHRRAAEAPTWVFPFDRPLPPGGGGQPGPGGQHRGRLGGLRRRLRPGLGRRGHRRSTATRPTRWPAARDCRTVAVAFQVVLLVGSVDVVVPQNVAVAVNYACVRCVTQALATQLVVSLPGPLSPDGRRGSWPAIWAELDAFGEQIEDVPAEPSCRPGSPSSRRASSPSSRPRAARRGAATTSTAPSTTPTPAPATVLDQLVGLRHGGPHARLPDGHLGVGTDRDRQRPASRTRPLHRRRSGPAPAALAPATAARRHARPGARRRGRRPPSPTVDGGAGARPGGAPRPPAEQRRPRGRSARPAVGAGSGTGRGRGRPRRRRRRRAGSSRPRRRWPAARPSG